MKSRGGRDARTSQPSRGRGRRGGSIRDPSPTHEKTQTSRISRVDENEKKKTDLLKEKVDRPKKEISIAMREKNQDDVENQRDQEYDGRASEKTSRKEINKEIDKKNEKKGKNELSDESDEDKNERDENEEIWKEIKGMKVKMINMKQNYDRLMDENEKLESRIVDLEKELKIVRKNEKEYLTERESTKKKVETLEKRYEISQDDVQRLRESLQQQLEDFNSAGKVDESWKGVEENLMSELKWMKDKLGKRMKRKELDEVILNLKNEVNELKKMIEVKKGSTWYSSPAKNERPNIGWWRKEKDSHCPVHSPEKDWWKSKKRKWWRPLWCITHGLGGHTTDTCWTTKKKIWRVKEEDKDGNKKVEGALPAEVVQGKIQ